MAKTNFNRNFALGMDIIHDHELSFNAIFLLEHADLILNRYCMSFYDDFECS